jgi:hypothetical protein
LEVAFASAGLPTVLIDGFMVFHWFHCFSSGDCQALNLYFTVLIFILFLSVLSNVLLKHFITEKSIILFKVVSAPCSLWAAPFLAYYEVTHISKFSYADYFNLRIFDISRSVRQLKRAML